MHNGVSFRNLCNNISGVKICSFCYSDMSFPLFFLVQGIYTDTAGNKWAACFRNFFQGPLDAIKNIIQNPGGKSHRDRIA